MLRFILSCFVCPVILFLLPAVSSAKEFGLSTDLVSVSKFPAGTIYAVCFSPQMRCTHAIVQRIRSARTSIYMQAYILTSNRVLRALTAAVQRGVKVSVIFDRKNIRSRALTYARRLRKAGVHCFYDDGVETAHNKVLIIDSDWVVTGSFNFTYSAQHNNAENVLMIEDRNLAAKYQRNWLYRRARSYPCNF